MPNKVVEILDKKYLIRPELRSGGIWYELTHDRMISAIKGSNSRWREQRRKRKSRRNILIIIPSAVAAVYHNFLISFLYSSCTFSCSTHGRHVSHAVSSKYRGASAPCSHKDIRRFIKGRINLYIVKDGTIIT